jgi:hypothetical protein
MVRAVNKFQCCRVPPKYGCALLPYPAGVLFEYMALQRIVGFTPTPTPTPIDRVQVDRVQVNRVRANRVQKDRGQAALIFSRTYFGVSMFVRD